MNGEVTKPNAAAPRKWLDDVVIVSFAAFCLGAALFLGLRSPPVEPTFIGVFMGVAVAAITYRYLGGTDGAQFSIAALKLGGSAALLLAVTWWVGSQMAKERAALEQSNLTAKIATDQENVRLQKQLNAARSEVVTLTADQQRRDDAFLRRVASLDPGDQLVKELKAALSDPTGPGADVSRPRDLRIKNTGSLQAAGSYWICPDVYRALKPDSWGKDRKLRLVGPGEGKQIDVKYDGLLDATGCEKPDRQFDMQISCDASAMIFPDLVTGCDGRTPRYAIKGDQIRIARVGVVVAQ